MRIEVGSALNIAVIALDLIERGFERQPPPAELRFSTLILLVVVSSSLLIVELVRCDEGG
jgi:hypothetical protein